MHCFLQRTSRVRPTPKFIRFHIFPCSGLYEAIFSLLTVSPEATGGRKGTGRVSNHLWSNDRWRKHTNSNTNAPSGRPTLKWVKRWESIVLSRKRRQDLDVCATATSRRRKPSALYNSDRDCHSKTLDCRTYSSSAVTTRRMTRKRQAAVVSASCNLHSYPVSSPQ
ncbi:hypothetical protein BGZ60DRAFT_45439 [Tricladium varicosporioides]|nr:hypothetical protein BGZ60DRAFT_45439 [Hymenoscyphus varicosporioides]